MYKYNFNFQDVLNQSLMEAFEELLDKQNMLRSELTTKDSVIEELRKENEVNV